MNIYQPEEPIPIEKVITPTLIRTSRVSRPLERYGFLHNVQELHVHTESIHNDDPTAYEEALCDINSSRWLEAMRTEMDSMYANQVCERNKLCNIPRRKCMPKRVKIKNFTCIVLHQMKNSLPKIQFAINT